ncbi:MAG: hypothetical protein H7147_11925, partial [Frankiaceae bacterium]|nr:hypothetical protein [Arenimonas sp.]
MASPTTSGAAPFDVPLVVGVTSHRNLAPDEIEPIRQRIAAFFDRLKENFPEMPLVMLSALAEGGDQLAAREALAAGARLIAPLPLLPDTYREDFIDDATRKQFAELYGQADVLQMPLLPDQSFADIAVHGEARDRQYAQAGVFIASHCHILLALWDGKESTLLGGTAQVVRYALDGVMPGWIERRRSERVVLNRVDESIVFHIACSRSDSQGGSVPPAPGLAPLQARWVSQDHVRPADSGMPDEFRRMFAHMREFNLDQRRIAMDDTCTVIDRLFAAADALAIHFQQRVLRVMRSIHVLAASTGIAFVWYADLPADVPYQVLGIYLFIALSAAGMLLGRLARRRDWHRKYIDYRALAEGLRVQRFWRQAGVSSISPSAFAHDHFLQKTDIELGWIRNVMRVPSLDRVSDAAVSTDDLGAVISEWIGAPGQGGQLDYYARKAEHRSRTQRTTQALGQASLWIGMAIVVLLALFQSWLGSATTNVLLAFLAVFGIIAAARESYAY